MIRPPSPFRLRALAVALVVAAPLAASAADGPPTPSPQEQALQGLDMVLKGLRGMIEQVPIYGPPEVLPNGDIILRRVSPPADQPGQLPTVPAPAQRM